MTTGDYDDNDRRRPMSAHELEAIKTQLLESIYADIGKSVAKKIIWVAGTLILVAFAWLTGKGHIQLGG